MTSNTLFSFKPYDPAMGDTDSLLFAYELNPHSSAWCAAPGQTCTWMLDERVLHSRVLGFSDAQDGGRLMYLEAAPGQYVIIDAFDSGCVLRIK